MNSVSYRAARLPPLPARLCSSPFRPARRRHSRCPPRRWNSLSSTPTYRMSIGVVGAVAGAGVGIAGVIASLAPLGLVHPYNYCPYYHPLAPLPVGAMGIPLSLVELKSPSATRAASMLFALALKGAPIQPPAGSASASNFRDTVPVYPNCPGTGFIPTSLEPVHEEGRDQPNCKFDSNSTSPPSPRGAERPRPYARCRQARSRRGRPAASTWADQGACASSLHRARRRPRTGGEPQCAARSVFPPPRSFARPHGRTAAAPRNVRA